MCLAQGSDDTRCHDLPEVGEDAQSDDVGGVDGCLDDLLIIRKYLKILSLVNHEKGHNYQADDYGGNPRHVEESLRLLDVS